jgi:hypothetical protein
MNMFNWLKSRLSSPAKALSAKKYDGQAAIEDYTVTIDMPDAPSGVKAMALYNRAMAHVATGDYRKGVDDLDAVLAMAEAPVNIKRMARRKLAKRESQFRKANV